MTGFIYKVLTIAEDAAFAAAPHQGYGGSSDDRRDGYIHLSDREQLAGTLAAHYRDHETVMVLTVAVDGLQVDQLRWERSRGGALFPHLYGRLPNGAVVARVMVRRDHAGLFLLPFPVTEEA